MFEWARVATLSPLDIDCITAVMLKILDGKCKMAVQEKQVMTVLYDALKHRSGKRLDSSLHELIHKALDPDPGDVLLSAVYEKRVLAETRISRPVMKAFKARLRAEGVLAGS